MLKPITQTNKQKKAKPQSTEQYLYIFIDFPTHTFSYV